MMTTYQVKYTRGGDGWMVELPSSQGCHSQGDTKAPTPALEHIREALRLMPKHEVCQSCGYARTEGSHRENPRWQGEAGNGKTFHKFAPEKKVGPTSRALADELTGHQVREEETNQ